MREDRFLDGLLDGAAASKDGIITANSVMAYVYDRVAKDVYSEQTPHYGFVDGDGDFIFSKLPDDIGKNDAKGGKDILIDVPVSLDDQSDQQVSSSPTALLKEYLSDPRYRIKLDEMIAKLVKQSMQACSQDRFPLTGPRPSASDIAARLDSYLEAIQPVLASSIILGKWASADHRPVLSSIFARMADTTLGLRNGLVCWIGMRWYPISYLMYASGIAALSVGNYENFAAIHSVKVQSTDRRGCSSIDIIIPVVEGLLELNQQDIWKMLPGHERNYTPDSEYMFKSLQPQLEDMLLLGTSYERLFDRYEALRALVFADVDGSYWGPVGRFGWKYSSGRSQTNPFTDLIVEAAAMRDRWPPLLAGMFRSSYARFEEVSKSFEEGLLKKLAWH